MVGYIHLQIATYIILSVITYIHCIKKRQVKRKSKEKHRAIKPTPESEKSGTKKKKPPGNKPPVLPPKASPTSNKFNFEIQNHQTAGPETELRSDADANLLGKTIIRDKILKPKEGVSPQSPGAVAQPFKPKSATVYGNGEIPPEIRSTPCPTKPPVEGIVAKQPK